MATLEQLERAFIAADDAGNTEDAAAFAAEIRRMRAVAPEISQVDAQSPQELGGVLGWNRRIGKSIYDLLGGAVGGAADYGTTLLKYGSEALGRPMSAETAEKRKSMIRDFLVERGVSPESIPFAAGELGTEIAGTAGIGGVLAAPFKTAAVASRIPAAAPKIATALETGGVSLGGAPTATGLMGGSVDMATRVLAGTAAGAGTAALMQPEDIETGAYIGAGIAGISPSLKIVGGKIVDVLTGNIFIQRGKRIIVESIGDKPGALEAAKKTLKMSPDDISAVQALEGKSRGEVAALGEFAGTYNPNVLGAQGTLPKAQREAQMKQLTLVSGGMSQEEAALAVKEGKDALNLILDPKRVASLSAANVGNETISVLQEELSKKAESLFSAMKDVGYFATLARQQISLGDKTMRRKLGVIGDVKVARHYDTARSAQEAAEETAKIFELRKAEGNLIQSRLASLEERGIREIKPDALVNRLEQMIEQPGISKASRKAIGNIVNLIKGASSRNNGKLHPYDIHAIRKEDINEIVNKAVKKTGGTPSELMSNLSGVRGLFDDAVEGAGGVGWRQYLDDFSRGANELDKWKMGAVAQDMLINNPKRLVKLVDGESPEVVENIFGKGRISFNNEMGDLAQPIIDVANQVRRDLNLRAQAKAARVSFGQILAESKASFMIPSFISPKVTVANAILREGEQKMNKRTVDAVVQALETPSKTLELLNTLSAKDKAMALKFIKTRTGLQNLMLPEDQ